MTVTDELITELRALTDERIPQGGSEADTRFSDEELRSILAGAATIEQAAARVWRHKAAMAFSERGGMEETRAGNEQTRFASLQEYRDHCLRMAAMFEPVVVGSLERTDFWK